MSEQDKADNAASRFEQPRKAFIQPSRPLITPTLKRDNAPSIPVSNLPPLPALNLPSFGTPVRKVPKERKPRTPRTSKHAEDTGSVVAYIIDESLIMSDEDFMIKTRAHSVHDAGMKEIFMANGGAAILHKYSTVATAFDALRREKQLRIMAKNKAVAAAVDKPEVKVYVPGLPQDAQRIRERAQHNAARRRENEEWINGGKSGR